MVSRKRALFQGPLQLVRLVFVGLVSRCQVEVIDYLHQENRIFRKQLGGRSRS